MDQHQPSSNLADAAASAAAQPCEAAARLGERAEWQLALLRGIAEDGAAMLKIIRDQAQQAKWVGTGGDAMFDRIARAVRQTIAFANRIEVEAKLTPEQHAAAYARRVAAEARALLPRPGPALAPVGSDAGPVSEEADPEGLVDRGAPTDREHLLAGLRERFRDPSVDDELNGRTYREILRNILVDVGANSDLSVFTAEELSRVYEPAQMRRRAAAMQGGPVVGDGSPDPGGAEEAPRDGPPGSANGHDPP